MKSTIDLPTLIEKYHNEDACRELLEQLRWPDGPVCNRCGTSGKRIGEVSDRNLYRCNECGNQFSVRVGTVLQDSKLPLWKWFLATYMIVESKKGVSAKQIERMLGTTYKTAWFLNHRIRGAMGYAATDKLRGVIEADETFVGGKPRYPRDEWDEYGRRKQWPPQHNKAIILGAISRGGHVRLRLAPDRSKKSIHEFIIAEVDGSAEAIYTDEWKSYLGLADADTRHESINHSEKEWVRGDVHTNTVEGVWSLLKRSIIGTWHHMSIKHLPAYLDEIEWRFNNRHNPTLFRDTLRVIVTADPLTYQDLVGD